MSKPKRKIMINMSKVVDEHNATVPKDAVANESIRYRQSLAKAFILDEADDLAYKYTYSDRDPKPFMEPLERCYRRGFEDAIITLAEKIASIFNFGLNDIPDMKHILGWVLKDDNTTTSKTQLSTEDTMITKQHAIDLFLTFETQTHTHFDAQLYRLIAKANENNKVRIASGFKDHVAAYKLWYENEDRFDFYNTYLTKEEQQCLKEGKKVKV